MKTWLARLLGKSISPVFSKPWDETRQSIYGWLAPLADSPKPLSDDMYCLPDEPKVDDGNTRWAAGALDGIFSHHIASSSNESPVKAIVSAIEVTLRQSNRANIAHLYDLLRNESPLSYIDTLLSTIAEAPQLSANKLRDLVEWLVTESPDRNVVKVAMAMLAFFPTEKSVQILKTLGSHDEFSLYAIVAIRSILTQEQYEIVWLEIARRVQGWGRIHLIERVPESQNKSIKEWLLREGSTNSVMNEYTALCCATHGELLAALREQSDEPLLLGAGEIIQALINGGPASDMSDYSDGAAVCECLLEKLLERQNNDICHYITVADIANFAQRQRDEDEGWDEQRCDKIITLADCIMTQPYWDVIVVNALNGIDGYRFNLAVNVSRLRNQDPWEIIYSRQATNPQDDHWYQLVQTDDPEHISRVISLMGQQLDLQALASGPANSNGSGSEYKFHNALGMVLQDLKRFPGMGWTLLESGLNSPVIFNRNMALNALDAWAEKDWYPQAIERIAACCKRETDEQVRQRLDLLYAKLV